MVEPYIDLASLTVDVSWSRMTSAAAPGGSAGTSAGSSTFIAMSMVRCPHPVSRALPSAPWTGLALSSPVRVTAPGVKAPRGPPSFSLLADDGRGSLGGRGRSGDDDTAAGRPGAPVRHDQFSPWSTPALGAFIGDYNGLAASNRAVYPVWTDGRNNAIERTGIGETDIFTNVELR